MDTRETERLFQIDAAMARPTVEQASA